MGKAETRTGNCKRSMGLTMIDKVRSICPDFIIFQAGITINTADNPEENL